jgi:Transposase
VELWTTDEHRIALKPLLRKIWAPMGQRPTAVVQHRFAWRYLVGFVHPASGRTLFHLATAVSIPLFEVELAAFARVGAGPKKKIVLVLDRAGWHTSLRLRVPDHVYLHFLPPLYGKVTISLPDGEGTGGGRAEEALGKGYAALAVRPLRIDGPSPASGVLDATDHRGLCCEHRRIRPRPSKILVVLVGFSRREAAVWYVGIDWADEHHDAAVVDELGQQVATIRVAHSAEGLRQLTTFLLEVATRSRAAESAAESAVDLEQIACVVETTQGLLITALLEAGFPVYPVNPKTLERRRAPSGAKTDALDAYLLAKKGRSDLADLRRSAPTRAR